MTNKINLSPHLLGHFLRSKESSIPDQAIDSERWHKYVTTKSDSRMKVSPKSEPRNMVDTEKPLGSWVTCVLGQQEEKTKPDTLLVGYSH